MKRKFALTTLMMVATAHAVSAFAAPETFKLELGTVKVNLANEWQSVKDFMQAPLTLMGPFKDQHRPVVMIIPLGKSELKTLDPKKEEASYKKMKEEYLLAGGGGKLETLIPFKYLKIPAASQAFVIGARYALNDMNYVESSYYLTCKGTTFHLKSLMTAAEEKVHGKTIDQMIESFSCE